MFDNATGDVLARAAAGDSGALSIVARTCVRTTLRVARGLRLATPDAWDVCQETWLALASKLTTVRNVGHLSGWLITTVRRLANRLVFRRRRPPNLPACWEDSVETRLLAAERDRVLWRLVAQLPARHGRLLILLAHRPELGAAEMAAELGIAESSVGPLRRRALARMRRLLAAEGYDAGDCR
ncbi:RNA polymerase sigma factor [Amycolatopsis suaedae]|uniref:Sigma-70 family RNA polymerase sigma factor n=1 Tax=Amycolatopsis suaedae TaxID=2510978 RepID=A0A4Q7JBE7_9PSEU|nr:sigma-70 family RNA polymerase sigma factor [Amycolatopsis suaedae]RZQ64336.1 sigma-70 family RNA polymerase sigma factor [Amycolatopsis suaedae]